MIHFCRFNMEFIGLGYKPSSNNGHSSFGFNTFELYRCKKCGKLIFENEEHYGYCFDVTYLKSLNFVKTCGYISINALLKNTTNDINNNSNSKKLKLIK